jgi:hypothetical protein
MATRDLVVMMSTMLEGGLYKGYLVGDDDDWQVRISHLQFVDDTLLVGEKNRAIIIECSRLCLFCPNQFMVFRSIFIKAF